MTPFSSIDLRATLDGISLKMAKEIDGLGGDILFGTDATVLAHNYAEKFSVDPVVILEEDYSLRETTQQKVKVFDRVFSRYNNTDFAWIDGMRITCFYPYVGDYSLFSCRASTYSLSPHPEIDLRNDYFSISREYSLHDSSQDEFVKRVEHEISRDIADIRTCIGYANSDVNVFNHSLENAALRSISERKAKLEHFYKVSIALKASTSDGKSSIIPVKRRIIPEIGLTNQKNGKIEQTFCITDQVYSEILQAIKDSCSTYERNPFTVKGQREEQLRNHILGTLNVMFPGRAGGETFRNKGKTDINIEWSNRAAFVAECKMWTGEAAIAPAINQLDGYTTWRDTKTALIFFVRIAGFLKLMDSVEGMLKSVPGICRVISIDKNEYDCQFESVSNPGQITRMRVFFFDYFLPEKQEI